MSRTDLIALSAVVCMSQACKEPALVLPSAGTIVKVNELRPDPVSGSRLRARVLDLGATDLLLDWWDRELDLACTFVPASDGEIRCLPSAVSGELSSFAPREDPCVYVVASKPKGPVRMYADLDENGSTTCDGSQTWNAYELEEPGSDSRCPPHGDDEAFVLGKRLPLERFVRAVEVSEHTDARLGLSVLLAEDGARQVLATHDQRLDDRCDPLALHGEDGPRTCVPSSALTHRVHLDSRCVRERGYLTFSEPACQESNRTGFDGKEVYSLEGPLKPPFYEYDDEDDDGVCNIAYSNEGALVYRQGDPLDTVSLDAGYLGKPIGRQFLFTDKQPLSPSLDYLEGWDHERDEGCTFLPMSSGDWICLPDSVPTTSEQSFEDAKCTKPVVTFETERVLLTRQANVYLPVWPREEGVKLVDVGEEVDAPFYRLYSDGDCLREGTGFRRFVDAVEDLPKVLPVEQR